MNDRVLPLFESLAVWFKTVRSEERPMTPFLLPVFTEAHASQSILAHGTLKKATEFTEEPPSVHNTSNIKLNTSSSLSFVYNING
jgi:hypothetical protein